MDIIGILKARSKDLEPYIVNYLRDGTPENLMEAVRHYPRAGGKMMRPVVAMVTADAVGNKGKQAAPFGAALELIHNFTLVHDDLMDNDDTRRGMQAVHVKWDMPTAILAGDALFAKAFEVLADLDVSDEKLRSLLRLTAQSVWVLAEGQALDTNYENQPNITIKDYIGMVEKKTSVLFAAAAAGGAIIGGGTDKQVSDMYDYAILLGIAFQLWDDVIGLIGDEEVTGKPVGSDIRNGKRTAIVIHAMNKGGRGHPKFDELYSILGKADASDEQVKRAIDILEEVGSIDYAKDRAKRYAQCARDKLGCLNDSDHKRFLMALADFAVTRKS